VDRILFVREQAYLGGVSLVQESDDCLTHLADLHHPERGQGRFYVKHYLDDPTPTKGLVNEVCGYLLAGAAGLPVADQALIVELPSERIAEMHPDYASRLPGTNVPVWASRDIGGRQLPHDTELASQLLRGWPDIGDLIAFDSWVVIPDRSAANLARRGLRNLVLIDHGHLAGSVRWQADLLPVSEERPHPFLALWGPGLPPGAVNQRIILAAERHEAVLEAAMPELNRFLESLLADPGDRIALHRFLQERANSSPARMKRVLQMLA
jgi:hypothetical protein